MTSMMRPTANRPTQNAYGAPVTAQPSDSGGASQTQRYRPFQAQPRQQSQGTPYQAYTPNANERPAPQQPSAPRRPDFAPPQSDFRQVGDVGADVMTSWYNPQTVQTYQTGSSSFQPVEGSGWVRSPRGGQQLGGDTMYAGGTPYFNERTGQNVQPPPFQMAPAQTPWGASMDPFAERDAFVNEINQQRMQNQIAFNSGGPTNPAAGMNPGIDYQLAMQQAGLAGGAPSMSPEYGDSLIARLNGQFGGQGNPFANQTQAAPFQSPFSIPGAPQQPAYYPGGTMNDGYGMGMPSSTPPRPSPAPRPRLSPAAAEFQEKIARRTASQPLRPATDFSLGPPTRPPAPNRRDVQAAFENPSAWRHQDPQEASRIAREEAVRMGRPWSEQQGRAVHNAAVKNNWLGPEAQRAVANMSQDNQLAYLMMGGFNRNEANDYSRRVSGRRRR